MAKVWFYNIPFHGHVNPTLPLIRELVKRGDQVRYYSGQAFAERIRATGATFEPYGDLHAFESSRSVTHVIHHASLVAEATHALLPDVLSSVAADPPDYLIFDMSAPWGEIVSRRLGIPAVASFPHLPFYWRTILDDRRVPRKAIRSLQPGFGYWRQLKRETGRIIRDFQVRDPNDINVLSSSAELNIVFSSRYFQPYPDYFDHSYLYVGPRIETNRREEPLELSLESDQPLIYIAVGTVYRASIDFFRICIEALANSEARVVMSVGRAVDPSELGSPPSNFIIEQYVPQLSILEKTDVFITHGGMNSISESVHYRVPMIVVPNTVEQSMNASRVEQLGAGTYLEPEKITAEELQQTVERILADLSLREGLDRIAQSFDEAVGELRAADAIDIFKASHGLA